MRLPAAFVFPDNPSALAAARELGRTGIEVIVGGHKPGPAALSRFARFVEMPDLYQDAAGWADAAVAFAGGMDTPPVLFASEDAALLTAERYHERLREVFVKPYPAPGVIEKVLDKRRLYAAAEALGIAVPEHREITDNTQVPAEGTGPWIVKPALRYRFDEKNGRIVTFRQATGATKAIAGPPEIAVREVLASGFPAILQEAVPGPFENLVTIALTVARDGRVLDFFAACKEHEYPEPFGDGLIVRAISDPGLLEPSTRLLRSLGYWGICDIEYKRDQRTGTFKLLDANPRTWLWLNLGTRMGKNLLLGAYNEATGARVRAPAVPRGNQGAWVSPRGSLAFLARCWRPSRHGLALPLRLMIGAVSTSIGGWRAFRDPLYFRPAAWADLASSVRRGRAKESRGADSSHNAGRKDAGRKPA